MYECMAACGMRKYLQKKDNDLYFMDYEDKILIPFEKIDCDHLLRTSYDSAVRKSELPENYYFLS